MFILFSIIALLSKYETPEKRNEITNERTSKYDISIALSFSSVTISKPQEK
jgi:hypothetical protein